jgi:hypothetical protein
MAVLLAGTGIGCEAAQSIEQSKENHSSRHLRIAPKSTSTTVRAKCGAQRKNESLDHRTTSATEPKESVQKTADCPV